MKILVPSVIQSQVSSGPRVTGFVANNRLVKVTVTDMSGREVTFETDASGTRASLGDTPVLLEPFIANIKSTEQLRSILDAHDLLPSDGPEQLRFQIRMLPPISAPGPENSLGIPEAVYACVAAGTAGGGCAAAGCATVGCAGAGCAAVGCGGAACAGVGCASVGCAAAGKGAGGCGAAGCAAVACGAAGCAAAGCGAAGCGGAGCVTVACAANDGACAAAACALDLACGANAGYPP